MSKRTRNQLENIQIFLKKNVFSSRYVVRNMLFATMFMTAVAFVVGMVTLIKTTGYSEEKQSSVEVVASVEPTEVTQPEIKEVINLSEVSQISSDSIGALVTGMESEFMATVKANEALMVANATGEFDSRFVSKEDNVNIRESAGTDSDVVGKMGKGTVGDIISSDGEWLNIKSGEIEGFVKSEFVLTGSEAEDFAKDYYKSVGTINDDGVNIRKEASTSAEVVATGYKGTEYDVNEEVTETLDGWVCILVDDKDAYVSADFIDVWSGYPEASVYNPDKGEEEKPEDNKPEDTKPEDEKPEDNKPEDKEPEETVPEKTEPEETEPEETPSNEQVITPTNRGAISLSEEDIYLMAAIVTLESGGECYEGQLAVANVIVNRLLNGYWGSTVSDVVYAPGQFGCISSSLLDTYIQTGGQASCLQAVRDAVGGYNNVGSYMYFRTVRSANVSKYSSYTIIGNHVFY